ncbi:hypothetical protein ACVWZL_004778 [Bradyrhizobium sp. GM2.4]
MFREFVDLIGPRGRRGPSRASALSLTPIGGRSNQRAPIRGPQQSACLHRRQQLKKLVPEDAKEASGHGIKAKRSKSGAISFDALAVEASDASIQ